MWIGVCNEFFRIGLQIKGGMIGSKEDTKDFVAHYGATPLEMVTIWQDLHHHQYIPAKANPIHYLWSFRLLKLYENNFVHAASCHCHRDTATKGSWFYIRAITRLKQHKIIWPDFNNDEVATIFATVDGVHCRTEEIGGFDEKMFSHKFNGPGLAYELVISIYTQELLSINGPFKGGTGDLTIYRDRVKNMVPDGKLLLGDRYYRGENKITRIISEDDPEVKKVKTRALSRHESFNQRLKKFAILREPFRGKRHVMARHKDAFEACCIITQYAIELDAPLFDV